MEAKAIGDDTVNPRQVAAAVVLLGVNSRISREISPRETALWGFLFGIAVSQRDLTLASELLAHLTSTVEVNVADLLQADQFVTGANALLDAAVAAALETDAVRDPR